MSEGSVLNRVVRCKEEGWELEADQRHADLIVQELGLGEAKPVSSTGEPEQRWEEQENAEEVEEKEASRFRALAARANHLAADRLDIMYATEEICHSMSRPTKGAWENKKAGWVLA